MTIKELTPMTAQIAVEWMSQRIEMQFPPDWMPETGLVVFDYNDKPVCAGILYLEKSSPVAVFGWVIANPANTPRESSEAVKLLINTMPGYARQHGATHLLTMFGSNSINRQLDKFGFINADRDVQQKYARLEG